MKGLNCYARFLDDPGIEKLATTHQVKTSFLVPVTSLDPQREPFLSITGAELCWRSFHEVPCLATAPVRLLEFLVVGGGRLSIQIPTDLWIPHTGRRSCLRLIFFSERLCLHFSFMSFVLYLVHELHHNRPTAFWRYRDIDK